MSRTRSRGRKPDSSCRNHGSCPWCQGNRHHKYRRSTTALEQGKLKPLHIAAWKE